LQAFLLLLTFTDNVNGEEKFILDFSLHGLGFTKADQSL